MKKFLISLMFLGMLPVFATCSVEEGATVCSLPGFREHVTPIYNPTSAVKEFGDSPEARLKPLDNSNIEKEFRSRTQVNDYYKYDSSCQFGVCLNDKSRPLFQQIK